MIKIINDISATNGLPIMRAILNAIIGIAIRRKIGRTIEYGGNGVDICS